MIRYEVTLTVSADAAGAVERWMRTEHIPAILATGCFVQIHFDQMEGRLRTVYCAESRAALDRYLTEHAPHFRADFQREFGPVVEATRAEWEELEAWGPWPRN